MGSDGILLIQIAPRFRILVAIEPVDGRKGIDSVARLCREKLETDPFSGCVFIFRTRRRTAIKLLAYDLCSVASNVQPRCGEPADRARPRKTAAHYCQRLSSHFKPLSLIRREALGAAEAGLSRSIASRFMSRSMLAYRAVVVGLECPSHWLIVDRSTPAFNSATAVLGRML